MTVSGKQDIEHRFATRAQAERYRDRFSIGRRRRTHERESASLEVLLATLGNLDVALDVGSGTGRFVPVFTRHTARLLQVDFSKPMLEVGKADYPMETARDGYVQADARHLPFADNCVDLVFCHRVLNHFPDPRDRRRILEQLARVTRRYVVVSCLGPPAILRYIRRTLDRMRGRTPMDGHVEAADLCEAACAAGLALVARTPIRSLLKSAAFFTFTKA